MQMKFGWKNLIELLGAASIVASLTFVGLQIRQSQQIGMNETNLMALQSTIEANSQINQYASVWVAGASGEELDATQALIFENLVRNLNDLVFFVGLSQQELAGGEGSLEVIQDFSAFLHRNPGARKVWELREARLERSRKALRKDKAEGWESGEIYVNHVRSALETLDASLP